MKILKMFLFLISGFYTSFFLQTSDKNTIPMRGYTSIKANDIGVISFIKCSPTNGKIAFTAYRGNICSLFVFDLSEKKVQKLVDGVRAPINWTIDGEGIIYQGQDLKASYLYDIKNASSKLIVKNGKYLKFSPSGLVYAYVPRSEKLENSLGLMIVNKTNGKSERFFKKLLIMDYNWSPLEKYVAAIGLPSESSSAWELAAFRSVVIANIKTKKEIVVDAHAVPSVSAPPVFLTPDKLIYPFVEVKGNFIPPPPPEQEAVKSIWGVKLYEIATGRSKTVLERASGSVIAPSGLLLSTDGKKIAIVLPEGIHSRILICDTDKFQIIKEILADYNEAPMDWCPSGKEIVYVKDNHLWIIPIYGEKAKLLY
ncbi:hypothetical protein H5T87_07565 [bacterium]|nr:hypothetical protein [bacterium]